MFLRGCGEGELFYDHTEIFKNFLLCLILEFETAGTKDQDWAKQRVFKMYGLFRKVRETCWLFLSD